MPAPLAKMPPDPPPSSPAGPASSCSVPLDDGPRTTLVDIPPPEPTPRTCSRAFLVEIYGAKLGRRIEIAQGRVVFGRDGDCGVPLDEGTVSRRHAELRWTDEGYEVEDLGSTNGTFINRKAVRRSPVAHGDELKVGRSIFKFLCAGTPEGHYHEVSYRLMTRDGLTGAWNRRAFDEAFEREISRARRYRRPLALIAIDVDHFKRVNDTAGHMAGDELLRQLAELLAGAVRREDVFARVGGEEFSVLSPESTLAAGCEQAERLRSLLEATSFEVLDTTLQVTASFGVAAIDHETDRDGSKLRRDADDRLYAAKEAGRNRVVAE